MDFAKESFFDRNGKLLKAKAYSVEECTERPACQAINNSGMSGSEGMYQKHNNNTDSMWLTVRNPGSSNYIIFDFKRVEQIGLMYVWNFNQNGYTGPGIRDLSIFYSIDALEWKELQGQGYPYRLAKAEGAEWTKATNLDDENKTPVDFGGVSARYVKLKPDDREGIGNWGAYIEGQHRYGLSEVRFYKFKPYVHTGEYLSCDCVSPDKGNGIENVSNSYGLTDNRTKAALHSNNPDSMWLSNCNPIYGMLMFDLDGSYPLGEMYVWNYNEYGQPDAGIKNVKIFHSIDGCSWEELKGCGYPYRFAKADGNDGIKATNLDDGRATPIRFEGAMARYVKIELTGGPGTGTWGSYNFFEYRYGVSKVRFYAANGYCVEPARDWTGLLSSYEGWSGADGIFAAPLDGRENVKTKCDKNDVNSIFVFSDTFLGQADPITRHRKNFHMVNNTIAYMKGIEPETAELSFIYGKNGRMNFDNIIDVPQDKNYRYWIQDCVVNSGKLYAFTDNVVEDPTQIEGFQFKLTGVDMIRIDINQNELVLDSLKIFETPLFLDNMYFGCGILPNTNESGMPFADGFIYIYGVCEAVKGSKSLVVSRVKPEDFEDFSMYSFFDGKKFSCDINGCKPICDDGASEMSITPIDSGCFKGKYLYIYSSQSVSNLISCRIGDSPWGPFGDRIPLYCVTEPTELLLAGAKKIYTYNSKAHYHLSRTGELLITTNVNSMDFESHIRNADIYRPRFFRLRELRSKDQNDV